MFRKGNFVAHLLHNLLDTHSLTTPNSWSGNQLRACAIRAGRCYGG
ncbi:hypothetical protein SXCC_01085 [Gluconacetobacter sp. SXCC-1]|nr:hypothetical protein SXCC_01085 [Gluconacetobacter sp. SXCC-1]